jgi:thioredoxin-like negative regulator of GroEL
VSEVPEVDLEGLEQAIDEEHRLVLADFWSPTCVPCRALKPHLADIADKRAHQVKVVAVNAVREERATERFGISGVPTLILFRDRTEIERLTGPTVPSQVDATIEAEVG